MAVYFSLPVYRKSRAVCLSRGVFLESMAVPTGSVRQSKEVYGESTTVYVSIWEVYLSLGSLRRAA